MNQFKTEDSLEQLNALPETSHWTAVLLFNDQSLAALLLILFSWSIQ